MCAMNVNSSILIVEDSATQATRLKFLLEREGYAVDWVKNGKEAEKYLETTKPDVIISDILMPEMDGFELCSRVKKNPHFRDIAVILVTALSQPEDVIKGLECGANNFLIKPYDEELLLSLLRQAQTNRELRIAESQSKVPGTKDQLPKDTADLELSFRGQRYFITAGRLQILELLISLLENTLQKSRKLEEANRELQLSREQLREALREKELLMREIHHRVKNNLMQVTSLLSLHSMKTDNKEIQTFVDEANNRIRTMSMIHETIYKTGSFSTIQGDIYFNNLIKSIFSTYVLESQHVKLSIEVDPFELPIDQVIHLALIFNELVTNSLKHAFPGDSEPDAEMEVKINRDGQNIRVLIADTGRGYTPTQGSENRGDRSFGLYMVELLVKQLKGTLVTDSQPGRGTRTVFEFPFDQES